MEIVLHSLFQYFELVYHDFDFATALEEKQRKEKKKQKEVRSDLAIDTRTHACLDAPQKLLII